MSFGKNIQKLRKAYGISQEEFASKLNVSRQAVSKWESGNGYPEMEKLLQICDLYQCSLDSLVKSEIEIIESEDFNIKAEYEQRTHRYALLEALGLDFIFIGVIILFLANDVSILFPVSEDLAFGIGMALLLVFIAIAIAIFNYASYSMNDFKRQYPKLNDLYDEEEINQACHLYRIFTTIAVVIILIAAAIFLLLAMLFEDLTFPITTFLFFLTIALHLCTYFSTLKNRVDLEKYNKNNKF